MFTDKSSATVILFFLAIPYKVSPFATVYVTVSKFLSETLAALVDDKATAVEISAEGIVNVCPILITSFSDKLFAARNSATVISYFLLIEYKVSPFATLYAVSAKRLFTHNKEKTIIDFFTIRNFIL